MPTYLRCLRAALLPLLLAACAGPLSPATVAPPPKDTAVPVATNHPTAAPLAATSAPLPLAANLPLAGWDENGGALSLRPVDPLTGAALAGAGWTDLGSSYYAAFAPECVSPPAALAPGCGRTLALLIFSDDNSDRGLIHFVDLPAWTMTEATIAINSYPLLMQFSADSRSLLVTGTDGDLNHLTRYDVATGALAAQVTLPFTPRSAAFTPDGAQVMVYGTSAEEPNQLNPLAQVALLDLATLVTTWALPLPAVRDGQYVPADKIGTQEVWALGQWYSPAVVWAPGAATLYLVPADADELLTVDFAAQTLASAAIAPAQTWLDRLLALTAGVAEAKMLNGTTKQAVLSPDGARLYVLGYTIQTVDQYTETPLGLQVVDTATGELLDTVDTATRNLSLGADAAGAPVLLLEGWGDSHWSEVRALSDPHTLLAEFRNRALLTGHLPNGQALLLAREDRAYNTVFHVIDPATWGAVAKWPTAGFAMPILRP